MRLFIFEMYPYSSLALDRDDWDDLFALIRIKLIVAESELAERWRPLGMTFLFVFVASLGLLRRRQVVGSKKEEKKNGKVRLVCFSVSSAAAPRFDLDFYGSQLTGEIARPDGGAAPVPWSLSQPNFGLRKKNVIKVRQTSNIWQALSYN